MESQLIGVRLPKQLVKRIEAIVKEKGYTSTQEFIREAIRIQTENDLAEKITKLKSLQGSVKRRTAVPPELSEEEFKKNYGLDKLRKVGTSEKLSADEIFKRLGLDDVPRIR